MPDLESRIADWRKRVTAALSDERKTLDELENHLRDEIYALIQRGVELDMAVDLAIAKLGDPETLAQLSKNTQPWRPIYVWGAVLLVAMLPFLMRIGMRFPGAGIDRTLLLLHLLCLTVGYILAFGIGGLAALYALQRMVRDLPSGQRAFWMKTLRWTTGIALAFTITGTALGALWASDHLGRAWGWDPREIGALFVMVWLTVLLATTRHLRWVLCGGMLGNLVVAFAWFGSNLIVTGMQLSVISLVVACGLVITHGLLMAGTLAPIGWLRWRKAS